MNTILAFFVRNYRASFLLAFFMILAGLMGSREIQRESRPPVDFARISITTIYPGSSPEEVEEQITNKIEEELRGIEGIKDIQSSSQAGRSQISIRVDLDHVESSQFVVDEVQRAVQRVRDLPRDILDNPIVLHLNAKEIPIFRLALLGSNEDRQRDRLAKQLKELLEDEDGVSEVSLSGYRKREFQVLLDPDRMNYHHVGISQVVNAVQQNTQNIPAGYIRVPGNQKLVRVTGQVREAQKLEGIVVRSNFSGGKVRVRDVAEVRDGMEDPSTLVRVNGSPATLLTVTKKADADTIRSATQLRAQIKNFEQDLPPGYGIVIYDDESSRIHNRLEIVINNALVGLGLVLVVLLLFLPGVIGVMASLSLPLALLGIVGVMAFYDINFNNITMLGIVIAIGMLVDNAVVISENYARLRQTGMDRQKAAIRSASQFWLPLSATVATTVVAFLPMLVTKGVMGQFIRWIPIVVSLALVISLVEAFFLLPARLQFTEGTSDKEQSKKNGHWFDLIRNLFNGFMNQAVRFRYLVFLLVSGLLFSSIWAAINLNRFELFPAEEVEYYQANYETPITTTLKRSDELAARLAQEVEHILGKDNIRYIISRAGFTQGSGGTKNADHVGMLNINIPLEVAKTLNPQDVLKKLRSIEVEGVSKLVFEESRNGPPVGRALSVSFRSSSYEQLQSVVDEFKAEVSKIPGVVDLEDDEIHSGLEYRLEPKDSALSRLNLNTEAVGTALRTALQGSIANELSIDGDEFWLRVRYKDSQRETLEALKKTRIMESQGRLVPLLSLVKITQEEGPRVRKHYNFKRSIAVMSAVDPKVLTSIELNKKAEQIFSEIEKKYPAVSATFGGENESTKESTTSLKNAMMLALLGIFAILVLMFNGYLLAILVLSSIPLGLVGVGWAFVAHQRPLSFLALIGVVGLAGVVVNSAIVLVSYIHDLRDTHPEWSMREILSRASSDRLRAVTVTSLTTVGGLFPTAYGWGGYDPALVPMTLSLAWGLVSGTLLTLIWIPCGYAIIEDLGPFARWVLRLLSFPFRLFKSKTNMEGVANG